MPNFIASDFEGRTRAELLDIKVHLDADMAEMRSQIQEAQEAQRRTGKFSDPAWWRKIHYALRVKGQQSQRVQTLIGEARRQEGREHHAASQRALLQAFRAVVRRRLPDEADQLWHQAVAEAGSER